MSRENRKSVSFRLELEDVALIDGVPASAFRRYSYSDASRTEKLEYILKCYREKQQAERVNT